MIDYITTPPVMPTIVEGMQSAPIGTTTDLASNAGLAFGIGLMFMVGIIILLSILSLILWVWSIVHLAKNQNFKDENTKIIWLLIVIFIGPIGSLIYLFARPKGK